ncbi:MAG: class I SAM-dependent methyltransferase, partial [Thermoleophilaceae bacterium]
MGRRGAAIVGTVAGGVAAALVRERTNPSACPYSQRWMLGVPRPWLSVQRLIEVLEPRAGERLLEVGPGTGIQTLP